jgi:hypothetical protein
MGPAFDNASDQRIGLAANARRDFVAGDRSLAGHSLADDAGKESGCRLVGLAGTQADGRQPQRDVSTKPQRIESASGSSQIAFWAP